MNRNEVTTAAQLQPGDIFYKVGDAGKTKMQVHTIVDVTRQRDRRIVCVDASLDESLRHKEYLQRWLPPQTKVVFLRRPDAAERQAVATEKMK